MAATLAVRSPAGQGPASQGGRCSRTVKYQNTSGVTVGGQPCRLQVDLIPLLPWETLQCAVPCKLSYRTSQNLRFLAKSGCLRLARHSGNTFAAAHQPQHLALCKTSQTPLLDSARKTHPALEDGMTFPATAKVRSGSVAFYHMQTEHADTKHRLSCNTQGIWLSIVYPSLTNTQQHSPA